jgi:hypothetical protein
MPSELFAEGFGSSTNPSNFIFLTQGVNRAKGRIETFMRNIGPNALETALEEIVAGDESAATRLLETLAEVRQYQLKRVFIIEN